MNALPVWRHGETGFLSVGIRDGKGGWEGQQLVRTGGAIVGGARKGTLDTVTQGRWLAGCKFGSGLRLRTRPSARVRHEV